MNLSGIDLFSGAGGFSLGMHLSGIKIDVHIEKDNFASQTLKNNFPNSKVITDDIRFVDPEKICENKNLDLIIGGPPCQGFSVAGSTQFGISDDRNELIFWYLRFVQKTNPKIAIIENVPNVLTKKSKEGKTFLDVIKTIANEMGYEVAHTILNSVNYGVPQSRRRAFIALFKKNSEFNFPEITHEEKTDNDQISFFNKKNAVTVNQALSDLPIVEAGQKGSYMPYKKNIENSFQKYCRSKTVKVMNHDAMKHLDRLIERFKIIKQGQSLKDVPISHGQIAYGSGEKVEKPFKYNNYRIRGDKPSLAIPASYQSLFIHPYLNRNLTAREGARLMSFPDWYEFSGPRTSMSWEEGLSQYNQIGNAVCPLVAKALGMSIKNYLENNKFESLEISESKTLEEIFSKLKKFKFSMNVAREGAKKYLIKLKNNAPLEFEKSKYFDPEKKVFKVKSVEVDPKFVSYAYGLFNNKNCGICNPEKAPFGNHSRKFNLLKSKSNLSSLLSKNKDHGLDFHLRTLTGIDKSVVNEVAIILEELKLVRIISFENPRTGKQVKSIELI